MRYDIFRTGVLVATVRPESGEQKKELMLTNIVSMGFTMEYAIQFQHGDYIDVYGERYWLNNPAEAEKLNNNKHKYNLTFQATYYDLSKPLFFFYDSNNALWRRSEFPLMCTAEIALDLVIANANRDQTGWTKGDVDPTSTKQLSFSGKETVLQALSQIASDFDTEWWIFNKTIHLAKKGGDSGYSFEYGYNKGIRGGLKRTNLDASSAFSRLFVLGSDQNLPADYRGGQKRLMLPAPQEFIQGVKYGLHEIERSVTFEDIKPERTGTVTAIGDIYTFSDNTIDFDINEQLMPGISAKVEFQTGQCAGYQFEIAKGGYNHATKTITILKIDAETALEMPSDTLRPAVGDEYILVDIIMPDTYREAAEVRLLAKGTQHFAENAPPKVSYTVPPDHFFFERENIQLNLGDTVHIKDTDISIDKDIRITGFTRDLHDAFKYTSLTLADKVKGVIMNADATKAEKKAKAFDLNKLNNLQRARSNWRTTNELATLLNTFKTEMLNISLEGGAYTTDIVATIDVNTASTTAGRIVHNQYTQGEGIWDVSALNVDLPTDRPYFLYIKAGRTTGAAEMVISETRIAVEVAPLYYYFPYGVVSSIFDGGRLFTTLRGSVRITPDTISLGRIVANNTVDFWDLNNSQFNIGGEESGIDWSVTAAGKLAVRGEIVATGARFINLIVDNLATDDAGNKRILISKDDNNIRLVDQNDLDMLVIDDDVAYERTIFNDFPLPPTNVYGPGILIGSIESNYTSLGTRGVRTSGFLRGEHQSVDGSIGLTGSFTYESGGVSYNANFKNGLYINSTPV